jgi:hypothetical protein
MLPRWLIGVLAVTLGLPLLLLYALVFSTGAVNPAVFNTIVGSAIIGMFLILMGVEIKRIADQPSDSH